MTEIIAPNLGQSGMEVKIETWHKKEGEAVKKGELLYELSNEKLNQEVNSPADGVLKKVYVAEGDSAKPGTVLAEIE